MTNTDESGTTSFRRRTSRLEWSETDQGRREETIEHVELEYGGELRISAGEGVVVEYEQKQESSLPRSLNELTGSPELAWMDEVRGDANVEWQSVEADSESWYRSSSGLTAEGRAAAAAKAGDNQPSDPASEDPGVPDMPKLYDTDVSFGTRRAQSVAGVQGAPREWRPPPPETGSGNPSTVTLHTVDITEPPPLPYDPYAPWLFGLAFGGTSTQTTTDETVSLSLGDHEIQFEATDPQETIDYTTIDPFGFPYGSFNLLTTDDDDDRQEGAPDPFGPCEISTMMGGLGCGTVILSEQDDDSETDDQSNDSTSDTNPPGTGGSDNGELSKELIQDAVDEATESGSSEAKQLDLVFNVKKGLSSWSGLE